MPETRILIVDDEPLARRGIRQLLEPHRDMVVVGECRNGQEALRALETLAPDLVFLDVQMPALNGFEVLRAYGARPLPTIVFVTAYDEFAVRAFEAHALDYLVKPVSAERFELALARVRERARMAEAVALTERIAALLSSPPSASDAEAARPPQRLLLPTSTGDLVIDAGEIERIEAQDYYAAVHVRGRRHLIRESLSSLEATLDPTRFVRVHRSAIVPVDRVRELRTTGGESVVVLRDGTVVPVSRRRREQVAAMLRRLTR